MSKRVAQAVAVAAMLGAGAAHAADPGANPVVIELFTSQGCSSCPPADAFLAALADRDDVIALALHVDYWDYLGWADRFASPAFTARQRSYARAKGSRTIYTPQIVVEGGADVVGSRPAEVSALIDAERADVDPVQLTLVRSGGSVTVNAAAASPAGDLAVELVRYTPHAEVAIARGENAGHTIGYANVVTSWTTVDTWNGTGTYRKALVADGAAPVVVILQRPGTGVIVAAARLR